MGFTAWENALASQLVYYIFPSVTIENGGEISFEMEIGLSFWKK